MTQFENVLKLKHCDISNSFQIVNCKFQIKSLIPVLAVFLLFAFRLYLIPKLNLKDGDRVRVTGVLNNEPQISGNSRKLVLGQFEFWTNKYPEFHYGDKVEVVGKVKVVPLTSSKLSSILSFNRYLIEAETLSFQTSEARSGIYIDSRFPRQGRDFTAAQRGNDKFTIKGLAIKLRSSLLNVYNKSFPKPYDGIMAGIVIGDKSLIPKEFWEKLKVVGTLHIMVASGTNVVFIGNAFLSILLVLFKRRIALLTLIPLIWFYSLVTGLESPVIRSAIMLSLFYLSQIFGRESDGGKVLLATGMIMLLVDPLLIFNVGFQLSFLATAGLVWIQPKIKLSFQTSEARSGIYKNKVPISIDSSFRWNDKIQRLLRNENLTSTLAAQIATLPILVSAFGSFNLLSPIANLAILWAIPYVLAGGMILGILGLLWLNLAKMASMLAIPLLFYIEQITNLFAKITFFQFSLLKVGWWWAIGYYVLLFWWVRKK